MENKKIAFIPHETRGQEIIKILEGMGGVNRLNFKGYEKWGNRSVLYIEKFQNSIAIDGDMVALAKMGYKIYTLEDWENENCKQCIDSNNMRETVDLTVKGSLTLTEQCSKGVIEIPIPEGYDYAIENGKVILKPKKSTYPKTYVECCEYIANSKPYAMNNENKDIDYILQLLKSLLICRDVYWKIAGEQMGLDKPWEPDWSKQNKKYCIGYDANVITTYCISHSCKILAFPTEEMRDAFYENFKELIKSCKELL